MSTCLHVCFLVCVCVHMCVFVCAFVTLVTKPIGSMLVPSPRVTPAQSSQTAAVSCFPEASTLEWGALLLPSPSAACWHMGPREAGQPCPCHSLPATPMSPGSTPTFPALGPGLCPQTGRPLPRIHGPSRGRDSATHAGWASCSLCCRDIVGWVTAGRGLHRLPRLHGTRAD